MLAITTIVARKAWLKSDLQGFQTQRQSNMLYSKILKFMSFRKKNNNVEKHVEIFLTRIILTQQRRISKKKP